jgi:hypothetical protein
MDSFLRRTIYKASFRSLGLRSVQMKCLVLLGVKAWACFLVRVLHRQAEHEPIHNLSKHDPVILWIFLGIYV